MDHYLIDYLRSGHAWLLIGSGPSTAMGYPDWRSLAEHASTVTCVEGTGHDADALDRALKRLDYPAVFEHAKRGLGLPRLRQVLLQVLRTGGAPDIYRILARWPVPVYLTTNFDDEISTHLTNLREPHLRYKNSEDDLAHLLPEARGIVCKLHGDLRADAGLVLTTSDYGAISSDLSYAYWRTKLTAIFSTQRVVVVGHSLTDPHIRHVLEAAKQGAGVERPVCWIAPDVPPDKRREYLAKWRVRVLSYNNSNGDHRNLITLLRHLDDFIPPRTAISVRDTIAALAEAGGKPNAAAPGYFVFNSLHSQADFEDKRVEVILAAVQSAITQFESQAFDLTEVLHASGWPAEVPLPGELRDRVVERATELGLLIQVDDKFQLSSASLEQARERQTAFEDARRRFHLALILRLKRDFPLDDSQCATIAHDIEASLIGYFREGGVTFASLLLSSHRIQQPSVPASIVGFLTESSARYSEQLHRQAFCKASLDVFLRAEEAERDYLGRVSQGFWGFHVLGAFGQAAVERLGNARDTVWLLDSNVQISSLAVGADGYRLFRDCLGRLRSLNLRLFTTTGLAEETRQHLRFANAMVDRYGEDSPEILALAYGQPPFDRANSFVQGFIRWRGASNAGGWPRYLLEVCGRAVPNGSRTTEALKRIGVEEVPVQDWPGFRQVHFENVREYTARLVAANADFVARGAAVPQSVEPERKSEPEAEAAVLVLRERTGDYHMLTAQGDPSPAWFISNTGVLNTLEGGNPLTWRPESFVRFASTLFPETDQHAAERAFDALVWSVAQAGLTVVEEDVAERVFGGAIDQATIDFQKEKETYASVLAEEYPDIEQTFFESVSRSARPMVGAQLAHQAAMKETQRRVAAEAQRDTALKEKKELEAELGPLRRFAKKLRDRGVKATQRKRRRQSGRKKR